MRALSSSIPSDLLINWQCDIGDVPTKDRKHARILWAQLNHVDNPLAAQCATYYDHLITTSAFNISSDLMMLCIPIPLVLRSQISLKRQGYLNLII